MVLNKRESRTGGHRKVVKGRFLSMVTERVVWKTGWLAGWLAGWKGWNEEGEEVVFRVMKGDVWRTNGNRIS